MNSITNIIQVSISRNSTDSSSQQYTKAANTDATNAAVQPFLGTDTHYSRHPATARCNLTGKR
jgi:hypothetical protein